MASRRTKLPAGARDPIILIPDSLEEARRFFTRLPPLPPGRNLSVPMSQSGRKRTRRCHGCHGLNNEDHASVPLGAGRCPLVHNDDCEGGIVLGKDKKGREWRPCPPNYVGPSRQVDLGDFTDEEYYSEAENHEEKSVIEEVGDGFLPGLSSCPPSGTTTTTMGAYGLPIPSVSTTTVSSVQTPVVLSAPQDSNLADELSRLRIERGVLEEQAKLKEQQRASAESVELRRQLQAEKDRIAQLRNATRPSLADKHLQSGPTDFDSHYKGPSMKDIRKVKGLRKRVEQRVDGVRVDIPSLGHRQSAPGLGQTLGAIPRQSTTHRPETQPDKEYQEFKDFQAWRLRNATGGTGESDSDVSPPRAIKAVHKLKNGNQDLPAADPLSEPSDSEEESNQPVILVYRRDKFGNKYRCFEPYLAHQGVASPSAIKNTWVTDPVTGREYKQAVTVNPGTNSHGQHRQSGSSSHIKHTDHRVESETPGTGFRKGMRSPSRSGDRRSDRLPGIIPLDTKEGRSDDKKSVTIVDWARNCPVTYAEKVKFEEMNLPLWVWAVISEILASRTGLSPDMPRGELEARLQHLLCVLQVALVNSEKTDFTTKGWTIASIYAKRVQQKLDRGLESWEDFNRFGYDPHPSEMISAKTEADKRAPVTVKKKEGDKQTGNKDKKVMCTTWNNSEVEGKCKYLVDNPSSTRCYRRHDCSYCIEKGHGTFMHQRRFCKKRRDASDE